MNKFFLGILLGVVIGAAIGFVMAPSGASDELPVLAAADRGPRETAPVSRDRASLEGGDSLAPSRTVAEVSKEAPAIPKARVNSILERTQVPEVATERGTEQITGQVLDEDGNGVAGVLLRATYRPMGQSRTSSKLGEAAPELSLEQSVQDAAERFAKSRAEMREARTDAGGSFALEGMKEERYSISAYKEGMWITVHQGSSMVVAPGEIEFKARRVVEVPLRVLMPSGDEAVNAVILCQDVKDKKSRLGPFKWSPESPKIALPIGDLKITAVRDLVGSRGWASRNQAGMASEEKRVQIGAETGSETIELQLEGMLGIRGKVAAHRDSQVSNLHVQLLALGPDEEVDLTRLAQADKSHWTQPGTEYSFMNLDPGRYAVGLSRSWGGRVEDHRVVEVSNSIVQCNLKLPELDLKEYIAVSVFDGRGAPLEDGVDFQFVYVESHSSWSSGIDPAKEEKGVYYIDVPSEARKSFHGEKKTKHEYVLRCEHDDYGQLSIELEQGQKEVSVYFTNPAQLVITVAGYSKSAISGRGKVEIESIDEEGEHHWAKGVSETIDLTADGVADFGNVAPGMYRATLQAEPEDGHSWSTTKVTTMNLELRPGPNTTQMIVPDLYDLHLVVLDGPEASAYLRKKNADGELDNEFNSWLQADSDGRVTFEDLQAGDYQVTLSYDDKRHTADITVPTTELQFDPREW